MVWPGIMPDPVIYEIIGVSRALGAELPYRPVVAMFRVEEFYQAVEGIAIRPLRVRLRRSGSMVGSRSVYIYFHCVK